RRPWPRSGPRRRARAGASPLPRSYGSWYEGAGPECALGSSAPSGRDCATGCPGRWSAPASKVLDNAWKPPGFAVSGPSPLPLVTQSPWVWDSAVRLRKSRRVAKSATLRYRCFDRYPRRAYSANFAPLTNVISHAQSMLDSTSRRCSSGASRASAKLRDRTQRSETVNTASSDSSLATTSPSSREAFNKKPENLRPTPWSEKTMSRGVLSLFHWLKKGIASSNDETMFVLTACLSAQAWSYRCSPGLRRRAMQSISILIFG